MLGHCTRTLTAPRRTSIRIGVLSADFAATGSATKASLGGSRDLGAGTANPSARSASTTQRRNRLAFIERARAAEAIAAPG
jgi:hypothetical protein